LTKREIEISYGGELANINTKGDIILILYIATTGLLLVSFHTDREKTRLALKIAWKKFSHIAPAFISVLILMSAILTLLPEYIIIQVLGNGNKWIAVTIAALIGSVTLMPGFIAFPLCGMLLKQGILYMVLSAFTTTLMMVGILTFPVEKAYFGKKVTVIRNIFSFLIALIVALATGIFFGEI